MHILIDVLLVALFAVPVISGWKRGFITTVLELVSFIIAFIVAFVGTMLGVAIVDASPIVVFVILFIVAYIALIIIKNILNVVAKLPVLKTMNNLLGLIVGLVQGMFFFLLAVAIFPHLFSSYYGDTYVLNWATGVDFLALFKELIEGLGRIG